jgi:hypothetical protein
MVFLAQSSPGCRSTRSLQKKTTVMLSGTSETTDSSIADAANAVNIPPFDIDDPTHSGQPILCSQDSPAKYDHLGPLSAGPKPCQIGPFPGSRKTAGEGLFPGCGPVDRSQRMGESGGDAGTAVA